MGALFYAFVYLLVFVLAPIVLSLFGALAALIGLIVLASGIYRASRRLATVGLLSLILGSTALLLLGPYAFSQVGWYFAPNPAHR